MDRRTPASTSTARQEDEMGDTGRSEQSRAWSPNRKEPQVDVSESTSIDAERAPLLPGRRGSDESLSDAPGGGNDQDETLAEIARLPWHKRPSIFWLLPAFLPFCLAWGGMIVPRVNLVLTLICQGYLSERALRDPTFTFMPALIGADNPQCQVAEVSALVAKFNLYVNLISGLLAAFVTPQLGAISDRIGRRKVIVFAALGPLMNEVIYILVGNNPETISVYWVLVGAVADGLCGSFTASMTMCYTYATDCTPASRRQVAFGYFHGTLFTGIALGPILAGYLIHWYGSIMIIFYVALGCHIFFLLMLSFVVPESLSQTRQQRARDLYNKRALELEDSSWRAALMNYNPLEPLSILWPSGATSSSAIRRNLAFLASIDTLIFGVAMGTMNILIIYVDYVFGWSTLQSSMFVSSVNIARVTTLFLVLPIVARVFRRSAGSGDAHRGANNLDLNLIRIGILFDLIGYIGYSSAHHGSIMVASGVIAAIGGMASPTISSALTKHVPADRTGQLLGATGLLHALARVVAPTIFNLIYAKTVKTFPQTVFVCLASVFVIAEILSWMLRPGVYLPSDYQEPPTDPATRDRRFLVHRAGSAVVGGIRRMYSGGRTREGYEAIRST